MNNIYKVIWSKAKNCYVVASEIARSHTKSATGSEKIGGVTRHSLLASLMALSLLCGGLGVASATDVVHVDENATGAVEVYTKTGVDTELGKKADKTAVEEIKNTVGDVDSGLVKKTADNATGIEINKTNISALKETVGDDTKGLTKKINDNTAAIAMKADVTALGEYAKTADVNAQLANKADTTALDGKANTDLSNLTEAGKTAIKTTMTDELAKKADNDTVTVLDGRVGVVEGKVAALETTVSDPSKGLVKKVTDLKTKTTQISFDPAKGTIVNGVDFMAQEVDAHGKGLTGVSTLHTTGAATIGGALTAAGLNAGTEAITGGSLSVTGAVTGSSVNAGTLSTTGNATVGGALNATGKVSGKGLDAGTEAITGGSLSVTGAVTGSSVNAGTLSTTGDATVGGDLSAKNTEITGTLHATGETKLDDKLTVKGEAKFEKNVTVDKDLTVNGKLKTDKISMKNDELKTNGDKHDSTTTITADGISNDAKVTDKNGVKTESKFTHDKEGSTTHAKKGNATDWKESTSNVTAAVVSNKMTDSDGNRHTYSQTATESKEQLVNGDKSKSNFEKKTAEGNTISITEKDADGNPKSSLTNTQTVNGEKTSVTNNDSSSTIKQEADQIRHNVTSADGKKSSIEVKAEGITNTSKDGTITNEAKNIENNATGDITNTAQNGSIINKAEHGDISNTAKNVTNEGTESVTNKVGKNEVKVSTDGVDITAEAGKTIKESVGADTSRTMTDGNIIDKAGDMTVTTDKTKGTTFENGTLNDTTVINGGTIGTNKVNANETNTKKLTAGADDGAVGGRLTVDANDGVKGSYKSDKYTSRSYILENTLQSGVDNDKKPTDADFVGSRTDHYMEGDKAKLDETVKDADGSNVTNKTSTSTKSTIKKGDITTAVKQEGDKIESSIIKDDNSQSNVTTSTVEATANAVTGKDANGNAQISTVINNKDGLLITNTDNQTSFTTKDGISTGTAQNWTNIKGNEISTGKVEANYVKMDYADVMKDLGVTGKTTTGSLEVKGESKLTGKVTMESDATVGGKLDVTGKATFGDDVDITKNLSVVGDVTANSYKVGDKTYIDANGIHANNQKITDVADGSISEGSKDAVNGGQLYNVKNDLEGKVNKVGANAAAMANLHPMEFDPDSKWNIAAAIGNYGSETAAALGAFYRPNDDVMVNLSTAFGTGENMVGGGVSVRLGKGGNKLSREESNALKDQVNDLTARMDALLSVLNPNMSKDFPDVPENHWAYEAVSRLAGNDIVQGYPDGEFHGERTMTRYEMAEIIYNALSRGAEAEKELVEEFKPELQAMAASEKATAERAEG